MPISELERVSKTRKYHFDAVLSVFKKYVNGGHTPVAVYNHMANVVGSKDAAKAYLIVISEPFA